MEIIIEKNVLVEELKKVNRAITGRSVMPILSGVWLDAKEDGLYLIGSDGDLTIKTFFPITESGEEKTQLEVISSGGVILPAKNFTNVIRSLSNGQVSLSMDDKQRVTIKAGKAKFTLNGEDADKYPILPKVKKKNTLKMKAEVLTEMLRKTGYSVSPHETRPILTGVNLFFDNDKLGVVSTDSHRLSKVEGIRYEGESYEFSVTIPEKSVKELPFLVGTGDVKVSSDGNLFIVQTEYLTSYTRLLEGAFPDTSRLIPVDFSTEVTIGRTEFLAALERISILSSVEDNAMIKMKIEQESGSMFESLLLSSSNDNGTSREEVLIEKVEGDDIELSFNGKYLIESLKFIEEEEISIGFSGAMRPFIVNPIGSQYKTTKLILPVRTY